MCAACRVHDGRRAAILEENGRSMQSIITGCGICDAHGFLITAKNADEHDESVTRRDRISKSTLLVSSQ